MPTFFQSQCCYLSVVSSLFVVYNRIRRWTEAKHTIPSNNKFQETLLNLISVLGNLILPIIFFSLLILRKVDGCAYLYKAYLHLTGLLIRISFISISKKRRKYDGHQINLVYYTGIKITFAITLSRF